MQLSNDTLEIANSRCPVPEDDKLLRQYRAGSEDAARCLVERHQYPVYKVFYWYQGPRPDQPDRVRAVFVQTLVQALPPRAATQFTVALYQAVRAELESHTLPRTAGRRAWRRIDAQAGPSLPLLAAIQRLDAPLRLALLLSQMSGLSYRDIAEVMGWPRDAVSEKLNEARRALVEGLHRGGGE